MHLDDPNCLLTGLLRQARRVVAFTGAGISTESGIPDFRSPGGVWSRHAPVMYDDFLNSRAERVRYWKMRTDLYRDYVDAKPNAGHFALVALERRGILAGVITQNIDGLHQDAGSQNVIELHGTSRIIACVACDKRWEPAVVLQWLEAGDEAPVCDECGAPLKSRTVSFGQPMPAREMNQAIELARSADVFLAIGSSLVVQPAASLPEVAKAARAKLVIINSTETTMDYIADLVIHAPIGETLTAAVDRLPRV